MTMIDICYVTDHIYVIIAMLLFAPNLSTCVFKCFLKQEYKFTRSYCEKKPYKLLFFGSDSIALSSFKKVNEFRKTGYNIDRLDLVITNNAKNKPEIEKYAQAEKITTKSWPLQDLRTAEYDLGLIVAFGHLIKDDILNKFPLGMVNVHPSLLPRWRGAAPIIHTLMHGDQVTGVTLMKIRANIFDVGEIISQRKVAVSNNIRLPELTKQLSEIGADMLVDCLRDLPGSIENAQPQSHDGVTYAKKINKSISEVRWTEMTAIEVYNLYRALHGIYPLTTKFRDKPIKLFDAFIDTNIQSNLDSTPGTLRYCEKTNSIQVLCKDMMYVNFKSMRIVGKREITALDFYNGYIKNMPIEKRKCIAFRI